MSAVLAGQAPAALTLPPAAPRVRRRRGGFQFGKYREIVIAVAFFLLFDLGVLVLNFYTSFRIAEDALGVNLSGRQRMLSQRTAKALLAVDAARSKAAPADKDLEELRNAVALFDASLKGFQHGATVPGGDGKPVFLPAATEPRAAGILRKAQDIWTPYQALLAPVLAGTASESELQAAVAFAKANNVKVLGLMNELTTALESVASERASNLRAVQTGGIVLALLNFAFILLKFLRRLRTSDAAIEQANEENREILASVREGLFLITPDFRLGSQLSQSAQAQFGRPLAAGDDFFALLRPLITDKALADARDYVQLLFSPHVKEALVQSINPLSEVEVFVRNRLGHDVSRHLSFHFNRVQEGGAVRHLLVTVQDISQRMQLERKLAAERQRAQKEFAMLLKAVDVDPALLRQFVAHAGTQLLEVNELLRTTAAAQGEAALLKQVDEARRRVHAIKGDAAVLGLDTIAQQAHLFETELDKVRQGAGGDVGSALLALPLPLEDLLNKVGALKNLAGLPRPPAAVESVNAALARLATQVAADCGKQVRPIVAMSALADLGPRAGNLLREIAVQLVRNAVTHGIETPASREGAGKDGTGTLWVQLLRAEGEWTLAVRDDGAGLSAARIRARLLALKWYTEAQLDSFSERQVVAHIFKPGFSTADGVTLHAGRGVGLDVVHANVQSLGGRLTLASTPGRFTEFKVKFPFEEAAACA